VMRYAITIVTMVLAVSAHAQGAQQPRTKDAQTACGVAAMTDYTKANLSLMQKSSTLMAVEDMIAQRRLEEEFCLRFVRCVLDDSNSLQFRSAFNTCLSDESLEKYDAIPREEKN
jgi:hypothetical protein